MTLWIIEPRDPVIFRDGKPFGTVPGARAKSLPFPFPSTVVGAMRTHAGPDTNGEFSETRVAELLNESMRGPILVQLGDNEEIEEWLFHMPADVLILKGKDSDPSDYGRRILLRPLALPETVFTDLTELHLVGSPVAINEKPHSAPPHYWKWHDLAQWLTAPQDDQTAVQLSTFGHPGPVQESRTHVSIDAGSQTAIDGALFQTSGLEFSKLQYADNLPHIDLKRLAMVVGTETPLSPAISFLGGERRVVEWRQSTATLPHCPQSIREAILQTQHCRLMLLTPAVFSQGYLPHNLLSQIMGVKVTPKAAAISRYQSVSGWDYAASPRRPKPTRRLAPAGSVYYLKLDGTPDALNRFVDEVWMQNVSDDPQVCRDGFGLAVLGTWDGQYQPLEIAK